MKTDLTTKVSNLKNSGKKKKGNLMNEKLLNLVCETKKFIYQLCVVRKD